MGSWTFLVLVFGSVVGVQSQRYFNNYDVKPGACPPALPVRICSQSCTTDSQCFRNEKCCPTNCGGAICTTPVTMRNPAQRPKPGSCPSQSVGKWVCSSTCTIDSDCSGSRKCCKNRCGAMVCEKVDVEDFPSVELPPATMKPIYELPPMNYPTTTERSVMYSHNPFLSNMNRNYNRYNK